MQVSSSITTTPPEPSMDPALASESKSMGTSISSAFSRGQELPPGITAFSFLPPGIPPATSSIMRFRLKPIGNS